MANPLYGQNKADDFINNEISLRRGNYGIHEYFEVVDISTADDDDVAGSCSVLIPAGAVILDAALICIRQATSAHGDVALEVHNAAVADDAASGGTEIVGADVASNVSSPDQDCDCSSAGPVGEATAMADLKAVDRTGAVTYLHVCAKEDLSSMTGSPQVGVYVKWAGPAAVAI
jgi:hypothetical protein